jgi:hypothetical protein
MLAALLLLLFSPLLLLSPRWLFSLPAVLWSAIIVSVCAIYQNNSLQLAACDATPLLGTGSTSATESGQAAASHRKAALLLLPPPPSGRYPRPLKEARTAALPRDRAPRPANPITDCAPEAPPGK